MRKPLKTLLSGPFEFIPKSHSEDPSLNKNAPEIKNRPLIFMVKKMTREDRFNVRSILKTEEREVQGEKETVPLNFGSVVRYVWENCVVEVKNVLLENEEHESLKGAEKDSLFDTEGLDLEIMECISHIQSISSFNEEEAKK